MASESLGDVEFPLHDPNNPLRRDQAKDVRDSATRLASSRAHPRHCANGDEGIFLNEHFAFSFTKGLPHDVETGLVSNTAAYEQFVKAIASGNPLDFRNTPLGHELNKGNAPKHTACEPKDANQQACSIRRSRRKGIDRLIQRLKEAGLPKTAPQFSELSGSVGLRAWESQSAGLAFDLEGPDAQAVTMPPPPAANDVIGSRGELIAEMAEVYAQALLRDIPLQYFDNKAKIPAPIAKRINSVIDALCEVQRLTGGFSERILAFNDTESNKNTLRPFRTIDDPGVTFKPGNLFRGITRGDLDGPYLSQFLIRGNADINAANDPLIRRINYGAVQIDPRVRYAQPELDYMTTWDEWFSVQCAAGVAGTEAYADQPEGSKACSYRLMHTARDLSTYVHYDALYEAYLNACLFMLAEGPKRFPFDPGIPFGLNDKIDHQQGFAHFGGPHILSLVTEVATRALKAVRFQKFNVHRRLRPEALAARIDRASVFSASEYTKTDAFAKQAESVLKASGLLDMVIKHNKLNNSPNDPQSSLLPMAFAEGSPMHPSYGAGHATVAGACVTVLKAFFDGTQLVPDPKVVAPGSKFNQTGETVLEPAPGKLKLTVEGELDKLAANISIGRDWAGVHYYSDYLDSIRMGERIAIGILQEQKLTFREDFGMSFHSFDGDFVTI